MKLSDKARYNLSPVVLYQDIHDETPPSKMGQFFTHIFLKKYVMEFIRNPNRTEADYPEVLNSIKAKNDVDDHDRKNVIEHYKAQRTPRLRPGWLRMQDETDIWYVSPTGKKYWNDAPLKAILTRPSRQAIPLKNSNEITA